MSVSMGSIVMTIKAIDEASGVMGKISASMGLVGQQLETLGSGFSQLGQVIQGFAVGGPAGAAIVGLGLVAKGLEDSVTAAGNMQAAWAGIESVLHLTGSAWATTSAQLQDGIDKLQQATTQSDLNLTNSLQVLLTYGMSTRQALDALNVATDIAAAKHIDLNTAATALGKAFQGNDMLLVRYGIDVATVTKQTTLGAEAIKELAVNLESGTAPQLKAFDDAMSAAGLAVADASGKMITHAAIVKEIETAWKAGSISGDQLSTIVGTLGINFQGSKALAMDYANVLSQVNDQYGGVAQAQATTYAGLQERLANAVTTLGEKIGAILLPALSSILEGLLPVVDAFTRGVGAIEDWLGAVAKIPAVQGAVSALQGVWDGLTKSFNNAWDSVKGDFMPALQELQDAFNQLAAALQPLWDALNEIWHAISGSSGDFNIFKAILEGVVFVIKVLAEGIRIIIPIVSLFAQGFKDLADFISPALKAISDAIGGFLKWVRDGFQAFYDWLVGHSLWQDLWGTVWSIVDTAITSIIGRVASGLFDVLKAGFTATVNAIQGTWNGITDAITKPLDDVANVIQAKFPELAKIITGGTDLLKGDWVTGLGEMAAAVPGAFSEIGSAISTALTGAATSLWQGITDALAGADKAITDWYSSLSASDPMKGLVDSVINGVSKMGDAVTTAAGQWTTPIQNAFQNMLTGNVDKASSQLTTSMTNLHDSMVNDGVQLSDALRYVVDQVSGSALEGLDVSPEIQDKITSVLNAFSAGKASLDDLAKSFGSVGINLKASMQDMSGLTVEQLTNFQTLWTQMNTTTQTGIAQVAANIQSGMPDWLAPIVNFATALVGGSIWPEMWDQIVSITQTGSAKTADTYQALLTALSDPTTLQNASENWAELSDGFPGVTIRFDSAQHAAQDLTTALQNGSIASSNFTALLNSMTIQLTSNQTKSLSVADAANVLQSQFAALDAQSSVFGENIGSLNEGLGDSGIKLTANASAGAQLISAYEKGKISAGYFNDMIHMLGGTVEIVNGQFVDLSATVDTSSVSMKTTWAGALSGMATQTTTSMESIQNTVNSRLAAIVAAFEDAKHKISSGSIWPDMLAEMVAQTHAGMAAIQGEFAGGFGSPGGIIPTIQAGGQSATAAAPSAAPAGPQPGQAITLPINVYLDGQQIQTFLEKRIVDTIYRDAGRGKRGKA